MYAVYVNSVDPPTCCRDEYGCRLKAYMNSIDDVLQFARTLSSGNSSRPFKVLVASRLAFATSPSMKDLSKTHNLVIAERTEVYGYRPSTQVNHVTFPRIMDIFGGW
jgi:hypothetical protein